MNPINVPELAKRARPDCTVRRIGPPPGVADEDCGTAEMLCSNNADAMPGFPAHRNYAYYKPNDEELETLLAGGFIEILQCGNVIQPFGVSIWGKDDDN